MVTHRIFPAWIYLVNIYWINSCFGSTASMMFVGISLRCAPALIRLHEPCDVNLGYTLAVEIIVECVDSFTGFTVGMPQSTVCMQDNHCMIT